MMNHPTCRTLLCRPYRLRADRSLFPGRGSIVSLGVLAVMLAMPAWGVAREPSDRPNILFIMVDDLGKEWVSCYGAEEIETPNVDALAAGGMKFNNAYSMPQCTPTRATLLTGQYPWRTGWCNHWDVPRWGAGCHFDWKHNVSFARPMKEAGYATAAAGKWQINDFRVSPDAMRQHGFDEWCMWTGFESDNPPSAQRYWNPYIHTNQGSKTHEDRFGCDIFVEFLIDFMTRHKDRPMMLYFPMALTHGPLVGTPAEPDVTEKMAKHKAMVRYTDAALGRLVAALDELRIRNNTIIIWSTDNGTSGGVSGRMNGRLVRGGKAKLTENGVCEPYVVNCPGLVPAGVETDALTDFSDLLPTFCELGGARLPKGVTLDGKSIAQVMLGKDKAGPRQWIMALGHGAAALDEQGVRPKQVFTDRVVRDKRYKLFVLQGEVAKLVDLKADPEELTNLLDSTDPDVIAARKRLEAVIEACPKQDARPRYDPTPAQPWDRKPADSGRGKR
ncbi:MAG: sulfatase-like hydrolase/transferase [Thermoguttaceae bacterium]